MEQAIADSRYAIAGHSGRTARRCSCSLSGWQLKARDTLTADPAPPAAGWQRGIGEQEPFEPDLPGVLDQRTAMTWAASRRDTPLSMSPRSSSSQSSTATGPRNPVSSGPAPAARQATDEPGRGVAAVHGHLHTGQVPRRRLPRLDAHHLPRGQVGHGDTGLVRPRAVGGEAADQHVELGRVQRLHELRLRPFDPVDLDVQLLGEARDQLRLDARRLAAVVHLDPRRVLAAYRAQRAAALDARQGVTWVLR